MKNPYFVWDWNGTLIDDVGAALNALNRMLAARGLPPTTRDYYRAHFGFPVRPFYAELGVDLAHEDWDAICTDFHRFIGEEKDQHLRPDARDALARVRDSGAGQSILSALHQDLLLRDTAREGVAGFFEHRYGVDNLDGASKLSRGRELFARLRTDHPEADFWFLGDTLHDAEVAAALGCPCMLVAGGHQNTARLAAAGVPVADSLVAAVERILMPPRP